MDQSLRDSGVDRIGRIPWGTHLCNFYRSREDLLEILVPYFRAGLDANEYCMWVTSEPLGVDDATSALRRAVPNLDDRVRAGQIEILPYDRWYLEGDKFDLNRVLDAWKARHSAARERGYEGIRVTGNTAWLEESRWEDFAQYEAAINGVVGQGNMMVVCTYPLDRCGAREVMDVVGTHEFALIKQGGAWRSVENSERKRLAEKLRESEKRLRLLFEHMTSGCAYHQVVYDRDRPVDYEFVEANSAFERMTGLERAKILGKRVTEVLPGIKDDGLDWIETYGRVATTGEPARFESRSDRLGRWFSVSAYSPAKGSFVAVFDDITERRRAEEQKEDLLRAVTHDLRTPLSVMLLTAERLKVRPESAPRLVDGLIQSCTTMEAMLKDLSEMSRLETGSINLERSRLDVGVLLSDIVKRLGLALETERLRLLDSASLPPIEGDQRRLERVFVNLITNALKYSAPDTEVLIETAQADGHVAISVTDKGSGIDAEDLPHVFDRFYRGEKARGATEGLGLGLYIAKILVGAHNGSIGVESEPGRGSRFRVRLPLASPVV